MARTSMEAVIDRLRLMTSASRVDEFQGVVYWTDDQLQDILDENRESVPVRIPLTEGEYYVDGALNWQVQTFTSPTYIGIEDNIVVYDSVGNSLASEDVSVAFYGPQVQVTLASDVERTQYYAEVTLYNMYLAAAEVWGRKASQRQAAVSVRSGQHQIRAEQERDFCLTRERFYRSKFGRVHPLPATSKFTSSATQRTLRSR